MLCASGSADFAVPMVCVRDLAHTLQEKGQWAEEGENWRLETESRGS